MPELKPRDQDDASPEEVEEYNQKLEATISSKQTSSYQLKLDKIACVICVLCMLRRSRHCSLLRGYPALRQHSW